jgi:DNA-binding Lrp family transcriptional regulator
MSVYAIGEHHLTEDELAQSKFEFELEDIMYIRLDPLEARLQQLQDRRILDNQYLFSLTPAARRWYELLAAKIFGVVNNKAQYCEIRYSWYVKHHHTLKRQYQRFRVVEQMKRVVRDHMESGYIAKVEYRAVKETDQEIDYIIRYYPGPGATTSMDRIQSHLRQRRTRRPLALRQDKRDQEDRTLSPVETIEPMALSLVTAEHEFLITELTLKFGINASRAYELVMSRRDVVSFQLEVWRFRQVAPRNRAGWMIQAIENDYEAPSLYLEDRKQQESQQAIAAKRSAAEDCAICGSKGFRYIKNSKYPTGAMRQCSHDAKIESQYSDNDLSTGPMLDDALNGPIQSAKDENDKRPAEDSASLS